MSNPPGFVPGPPNPNLGKVTTTLNLGPRNPNEMVRGPPGQYMQNQIPQMSQGVNGPQMLNPTNQIGSVYGQPIGQGMNQMRPQGIVQPMGQNLINPQLQPGQGLQSQMGPSNPHQMYPPQQVPIINRPPMQPMANINPNNPMQPQYGFPQAQRPGPPSMVDIQMRNPQFGNNQAGYNLSNNPQGGIPANGFSQAQRPGPPSMVDIQMKSPQFGNNQASYNLPNNPQGGMPNNFPQNPQNTNPPRQNVNQPFNNPSLQAMQNQNPQSQIQFQVNIYEKTEPCSSEKAKLIQSMLEGFIKSQFNLTEITHNGNQYILRGQNPAQVDSAHRFLRDKINEVKPDVKWAWIDNDGSIKEYTEAQCRLIETAYLKRIDFVLNHSGSCYRIKFGNPHIQQLMNSNITRTVRRLDGVNRVNIAQQGDVPWFWQDDDGLFKPYTAEASRQIENAYRLRADNELALVQGSNNRAYLMNFNTMKQLNEKTQYQRSIKRESPN